MRKQYAEAPDKMSPMPTAMVPSGRGPLSLSDRVRGDSELGASDKEPEPRHTHDGWAGSALLGWLCSAGRFDSVPAREI